MNNTFFHSVEQLAQNINILHVAVGTFLLILTIIEVIEKTKQFIRCWRTRYLRKVWGIKNGDYVTVVCSELDNPAQRQNEEPREFIYNLKYGDVDAYFEVIITLLRLYPDIKLRKFSAGEAGSAPLDMARHLILIGGPDYNSFTERILEKQITQYSYKSIKVDEGSTLSSDEIALYDSLRDKEYFENIEEKDYGYFERIENPDDPTKNIILIGGCHTLGVTGAAKAFSMAESEKGEIPCVVLTNAKKVAKKISKKSEYAVLVSVERVAQTINVPIVQDRDIMAKEEAKQGK